MKRLIFIFTLFFIPLFGIENYQIIAKEYEKDNELFLISRHFDLENKTFYLATNTRTLKTEVLSLDSSKLKPLSQRFYQTTFAKSLKNATDMHAKGGTTSAFTKNKNAIYLTIDFCPSLKKGYESEFLNKLTSKNGKTPIAVAITTKWIDQHKSEFDELANNPLLDITWLNHSHTHFYDKTLEDNKNFLLHESTDIEQEIIGVEKKLLSMGITPSPFFRFPGLISDKKLMQLLRERYFLIPLGANAWVAKDEQIKEGSFILIHGNKNEPKGIDILESQLPTLLKKYHFSPIAEAF